MDMHKLPGKNTREILTSTAWNALIHHPVGVEEDEAQDLPSTVDMDAIKGAPSTPLTAPSTPWSLADHCSTKTANADDSSSDEEDDDSDGTTKSSTGSDSDDSGSESCSWSTSSSSRSSSSSRTDPSDQSTPSRQTFSVSKSDVEGGLKLRISATKISCDNKWPRDARSADTESDHSSAKVKVNQSVPDPSVRKIAAPKSDIKLTSSVDNVVKTEVKESKKTPTTKSSLPVTSVRSRKLEPKPPDTKSSSKKTQGKLLKHDVKEVHSNKRGDLEAKKSADSKLAANSSPKKKITEASRLRTVRKKSGVAPGSNSSGLVAASSSLRHARAPLSQSSRSCSTTSESSESEEGEGSHEAAAHITQLAQQLGHLTGTQEPAEPTETLPSMTEHLQVINQEDLAAILPDVVTTETIAGFDGFEDVSSESGKAEKKDTAGNTGADSGSDVELPDQIVSDAIKRIHVDSEDVDNSDCDKDAGKSATPKSLSRNAADSDSSSGDEASCSPMYSSSLLQQFVEKTEILSAQCERLISAGRAKKQAAASNAAETRIKKSKSLRGSRGAAEGSAAPMPELESYRLDCSLSNVSPDSGIQSVPGSPVHDATHAAPPVLRPVSPQENALKKRRGRPKKSNEGLVKEVKDSPKLEIPPKLETSPSSNNLVPSKRGPGRPKKNPPVLELSAPISNKSNSGSSKLNLVLNEICERVNRRLDSSSGQVDPKVIELKDLERIINDHKSTKARNSKIDAIFSKSKKLFTTPNIAIVKPMQHHILNERNDDDEKQNKKGGKRGKDRLEDAFLNVTDLKRTGSPDDLERKERDKKKHDKDKKMLSKNALTNHNRAGRTGRARSRHLSSGTDVSCDKSVDSEVKKTEARNCKSDRPKEIKKSVPLIEEVDAGSSKQPAVVSCAQLAYKKMTRKKNPKFLSLHRNLIHHKLKRKKKDNLEKLSFISDLEQIISVLKKISIEESKKNLPTAPVAPIPLITPSPASVKQSTPDPRVKRIGKKRKASEKTRSTDKDSAGEKTKLSDRESSTEDPVKDKEKEKPKRKQKKALENSKETSEASPNEQRLPLKKRHYHIAPTSQTLSENDLKDSAESPSVQCERSTSKEVTAVRKENDRTRERDTTRKEPLKDVREAKESQPRILRSSVEDTIEATINRFSTGSPTAVIESGQRTVIVTPKKRHRVQDEAEDKNECNEKGTKEKVVSTPVAKSAGGKSQNSRPIGNLVTDKGGGKPSGVALGREGVIKSIGNTEPKRRSGSRSSSINKDATVDKTSGELKLEKSKRMVVKSDSKVKPVQNEKRQTRSATKPVDAAEKNDVKPVKQPTAGIFEPSKEEVEIDNSILVPLNSPSEMKNDLKGSLSAKNIKASKKSSSTLNPRNVKSEKVVLAITSLQESAAISSLTTAKFILRAAEMKKKSRRRKFINRTGFPTARRRKKTLKYETEGKTKTVDRSVISPELKERDSTKTPSEVIVNNSVQTEINVNASTKTLPEVNDRDSGAKTHEVNVIEPVKIPTKAADIAIEATNIVKSSSPARAEASKMSGDVDNVDTDDDIPLQEILQAKTVPKISHKIEAKLNAGRILTKRSFKQRMGEPTSKKRKVERVVRLVKPPEEPPQLAEAVPTASVSPPAQPQPAPIRKRKRSNTIKNTKTQMKSRYQLPLLSMKKFKKAKIEEKPPSDEESEVAETRKKSQPRWRKKYLTAGLFSDFYKDENVEKPSKPVDKPLSKWVYNPEEHPLGLLPPPAYCEKFVRRKREDFRLPYDLWWLHANNQLPGRDIVPSWNYRKIRTNVYYDVKPQTNGKNESQSCNCKLPTNKQKGCGDECINRMVLSECSPQLCPCGERCSNQRIQRHEYAPGLEKYMTKDKGWGVRSSQTIKAGDFILEYVGEVVSEKEFKDRMQSRYVNDTHHYCLHLDGGLVIDGHRMGGDGRFVNHSCEPNCEMQKWTVNGLFRMALFALRDIAPNQELSYDYNFSLFDPAEGQVCLCYAKTCRGVIGGKSQRVPPPGGAVQTARSAQRDNNTGRGRKAKAKRHNDKGKTQIETTAVKASMKPMSHQQRCFAQLHRCFLLRNVEKVRRGRDLGKSGMREPAEGRVCADVKPADVFYTQLNALSTFRSIKTRRLAQAEDNPELAKVAKLAHVFKLLYSAIVMAKDEKGELLAAPFTTLPSKKKQPQYYTKISDPIDLTTLEQNINNGKYGIIEAFDEEVNRLLSNNVRFYGRTSELGIAATRLKRTYNIAKLDVALQLEEILGDSLPPSFLPEKTDPGAEEEDVIRCICGLYKDEGVMIQCERCLVWQHCDCVKEDDSCEHYLCERCEPRTVNYEILMEPVPEYAEDGQTHYISLMRGTLQLRLGDTVYVLRDMLEESVSGDSPPRKVTYKTAKNVDYADLDIFRIEQLWIDDEGGKFAFGHHYLRPHETYHEPSRKFFVNEVMRVPLYEVVPLDLILQHCWVLDLGTFCKGRPVGAPEEHVYICEYRVDKNARLFAKIAKPYPICTKNYAFEKFDTKLRPVRTYTPHGSVPSRRRARGHVREEPPRRPDSDEELPLARVRDHAHAAKRDMQKKRLSRILLRLLGRLPKHQPLDVTYLLEPVKRATRKKSTSKKS